MVGIQSTYPEGGISPAEFSKSKGSSMRRIRISCIRRKKALEAIPATYLCDAWFLQDLIRHLTSGADEEIAYITGLSLGKFRVLSRICAVRLAQQSPAYALGKASSCANAL